jgi:chromosome segregation ATPase
MPIYADKIIQLEKELKDEKEEEARLSEQLENPENEKRGKSLNEEFEEPDQEALEAKIQVLEERLNIKKESLLEKELILDEVTNLSENLRK